MGSLAISLESTKLNVLHNVIVKASFLSSLLNVDEVLRMWPWNVWQLSRRAVMRGALITPPSSSQRIKTFYQQKKPCHRVIITTLSLKCYVDCVLLFRKVVNWLFAFIGGFWLWYGEFSVFLSLSIVDKRDKHRTPVVRGKQNHARGFAIMLS